jgi:tetratricopeptide (TPR) repeat protein
MKKKDLALDLLEMALARKREPVALATALIALDRLAVQRPEDALTHYASGRILLLLGRYQLALGAFRTALEYDGAIFEAHYYEGVCHWMLGFDARALAKFEDALAIDEGRFEPMYDAGQIFANRGEHARALRAFELASERAPDDFGVQKKLLQAQIRVGLWESARRSHERLRRLWATSIDPSVRDLRSYVLDQFEVGEHAVLCIETFEPAGDPSVLMTFAVTLEGALSFSINLESSVALRAAGLAWVLVVQEGDVRVNTGASFRSRPGYPLLRREVEALVRRWTAPE